MKTTISAVLLCLSVAGTHCWLKDLSPYKTLIIRIHNFYRTQEQAANMKELQWDNALQRKAELWSENCHWGHQKEGLGENLAYFWTTGPEMSTITTILRSCQNWWKEVKDWSWSTSCGAACHYTQMIWGKTERIGCSLSKCATMSTDSGDSLTNADYFVCFYDPPGNYIGQYPFKPGTSCSACDPGYTCKAGLCAKKEMPVTMTTSRATYPSQHQIPPPRFNTINIGPFPS